jgi:hypothetical protein
MDDIAFFDSSSYSRRGGIWPEAGRREKPSVSTIPSDDDALATAVPPEVDPSLLTPSDPDKGFHTEGDVKVETNPSPTPPPLPHRAATPSASRGSSPTPTHSLNHDRLSSANGPDPHAEILDFLTEVTPLDAHHPPLRHQTSSSSEKSKKKRFLGVRRTSRSPSPSLASNASSRELSPAPSLEKLRTSSPEPLPGGSSHGPSRLSKSPTLSSQTSLLSTFKSRAGDRQALSNTARETMRKWTVNWGGLKKDRDQNATASSDDARDARDATASQKGKSNYADIRAAVDGRREKERRKSDVPSPPIHIPDRGHKGRADSVSSLNGRQGSSFSSQAESSPASSFVEGSVDPPADETALPEQAIKQLPTIDVDGAQVDLEETTETDSTPVTAVPPPVPLPPRPIQSQPSQGKTMTIPSIHARNRGEVMSMGYVPPSPSPTASEAKTGVSSVYRLWKQSPATQSEPASQDDEQVRSVSPPALNADGAETVTTPVPPPAPAPKPTAPPLPPRSPTALRPVPRVPSGSSPASEALMSIASRDEQCRVGSEGAQRDDGGEGGDGTTTLTPTNPPAPALAGPKPPLPARKIHASA